MAGDWARSRCRDRLARLVHTRSDIDTLRFEAIDLLRRAIGFDAWGWPLADPDSLLATTGIADPVMWPVVPRLVAYEERASDVNRDVALATAADPIGVLSTATQGDPARSARFREILGPYGFSDELRAACVDRYGCWAHLRLYRDAKRAPFRAEDADLLRAVIADLASALRRRVAVPQGDVARDPLDARVIVLDEQLVIRSWTRGVDSWFDAFAGAHPPRGANARCAVLSVAARCLAGRPARSRLRLSDGRWVVTEAARLEGADRGVVVTARAARTRDVLDLMSRSHGLTPRERQLVQRVVDGLDTDDIARSLGISRHTVQQHLKAVFAKVGVRSRRELVTGVFAAG